MKAYKKVAILGVGLLGGSIGLVLKKRRLAQEIVGHFRNPKKIRPAVRLGLIDTGTTDLKEAVRDADVVVVCTPVSDIERKLTLLKTLVVPRRSSPTPAAPRSPSCGRPAASILSARTRSQALSRAALLRRTPTSCATASAS